MRRTVELSGFDAYTDVPEAKLHGAVGYLSMWNIEGFSHVRIVLDVHQAELIAFYWSEDPESVPGTRPDYVIGAFWHEGRGEFSFKFCFRDYV